MTTGPEKATREDLVAFRVDIWKSHIEHVRNGQAMRYDILRYTIVGLAFYFSFLLVQADQRFLCNYPDFSLLGLPIFVLAQVFVYISLVNRNISKHGAFLKYLFTEGLEPLGMGAFQN